MIFVIVFVQVSTAQKFELGKVTKEELLQKKHSKDTSAPAAILFKQQKTNFLYNEKNGFYYITDVEIKIKVYANEGLKFADFSVPYYVGYKQIKNDIAEVIEANTYNLENGKIDKQKLTSKGMFKQTLNENWNELVFTLPNVKKGSVIEVKYQITSNNVDHLPKFNFQESIPVNFARLFNIIPDVYSYKELLRGYFKPEIERKVEFKKFLIKATAGLGTTDNEIEFRAINSSYTLKDLPALTEEPYVDCITNYQSSILFELQAYYDSKNEKKGLSLTWDEVAETIYKSKKFGEELGRKGFFETDLKFILNQNLQDESRLLQGLEFVKSKVKWNSYDGYLTREGVANAYNKGSGNVAEVNLFLIKVLNYLNIPTYPVLLSTRSNGISPFPNTDGFNYVIAASKINGETWLLDATSNNAYPNQLPFRCLNGKGRLIYDHGESEEIDLLPKYKSSNIFFVNLDVDIKGVSKGKFRQTTQGYFSFLIREKYKVLNQQSVIQKYESNMLGVITDYQIQNLNNLSDNVKEEFEFETSNLVEIINNKLYINSSLFLQPSVVELKSATRNYPLNFGFKQGEKKIISITIPDGYELDYIPTSINTKIPDLISYQFLISKTGNKLQVNISLDILSEYASNEDYPMIKELFQKIIDKESEKIVLRKI